MHLYWRSHHITFPYKYQGREWSFYGGGYVVVDSLLIVAPIVGLCVCPCFFVHCYVGLQCLIVVCSDHTHYFSILIHSFKIPQMIGIWVITQFLGHII